MKHTSTILLKIDNFSDENATITVSNIENMQTNLELIFSEQNLVSPPNNVVDELFEKIKILQKK